ncbi:MAG: hypothetical protein WCR59_08240, partial [Planctomycetota bacterium]
MKRLCFLVELRVTGNELPGSLTLWRGRSERQARRYAEWLSRATLLRMEDAVGDTLEVLLPGAALSPRPMSNGPVPALVRVDATQQQGAAMWILGFVPPLQRRLILVGGFISLLISLTATPMLCSLILKARPPRQNRRWRNPFSFLISGYERS